MHAHTLSDICDAEPPVSQLMTFSARVTHTHTHKITLILTFYFTLWCRLPPVEHKTTIKRIRKSPLNSISSIRFFLTFRVCYLDRIWAYLIRIFLFCSNKTKTQRCSQSSQNVGATERNGTEITRHTVNHPHSPIYRQRATGTEGRERETGWPNEVISIPVT